MSGNTMLLKYFFLHYKVLLFKYINICVCKHMQSGIFFKKLNIVIKLLDQNRTTYLTDLFYDRPIDIKYIPVTGLWKNTEKCVA